MITRVVDGVEYADVLFELEFTDDFNDDECIARDMLHLVQMNDWLDLSHEEHLNADDDKEE